MSPQPHSTAPNSDRERLYGLDPAEFVAARVTTVRELRSQGRRDEAAAVEKLRKPSIAAWIVNRIARDEPGLLGELLEAGARLREVQLAAGSAHDLRAAVDSETAALEALMPAARRLAAHTGSSGDVALRRARETLHAAALDPDLAEDVRGGMLAREQQAVGFPMGVAVPARVEPSRSRKPKPETRPARTTDAVAAKRLERAAKAAAAAQEKLATAAADLARRQDDLEAAEADLDQARRTVTAANQRVERAQHGVNAAGRARDDASRRAEEATARHRELGGGN
jgi:hypothetical protein